MHPRYLVLILVLLLTIYVLSPLDLVPEILLGPIGLVDDLLIAFFIWGRISAIVQKLKKARQFYESALKRPRSGAQANVTPSPHEILDLRPGCAPEEIDAAYRRMIALYHPDKVEHLGRELRELAHEKTLMIQEAYQKLKPS